MFTSERKHAEGKRRIRAKKQLARQQRLLALDTKVDAALGPNKLHIAHRPRRLTDPTHRT
jgi:hypothetical protein